MSALEIRVQHRFDAFELDVDIAVPGTGVTALFGHSGAGKSSVIQAVAGLLRPQIGCIRLDGHALCDTGDGSWIPPAARPFGCVLQRPLLFPHLTVEQNCQYGGIRRSDTLNVQEVANVYRVLGLMPLLKRYPRHLSGGEQQRVSLARAILSRPRMLLLDEPLSAVDEARRGDVFAFLEALRDEAQVPILYVSHAIDEVARLADQVVVMAHGHVVEQGRAQAVLSGAGAGVGRDGGAVVHGVIARHDTAEGLSVIAFDGGELSVPLTTGEPGAAVRLLVKAADVMLSTAALPSVSANNVLPVRIESFSEESDGSVVVALVCGMTGLAARVTGSSVRRLGLRVGDRVFAVFKAERLRST